MDSTVNSALEEICACGAAGILLSDLWPAISVAAASIGVKKAIWLRLLSLTCLRFQVSDAGTHKLSSGSGLRNGPSGMLLEEAERLRVKVFAEDHLRDSFVGIDDRNSSTSGTEIPPLQELQRRVLDHLAAARYEYPPPDGNILTNIVNALIAVPRFYTQVLHLMNKMNIPAPFRMALPTPPLPPPVPAPAPPPPPVTAEPPLAGLSSDESEMESSEEDVGDNRSRKRAKRESIVGPAVDKNVAHESVGLKPITLVSKEVPVIKKKNQVLQIKITPKPTQKETIDDDDCMKQLSEPVIEHVEQKPYATPQDIEGRKLPPEEILCLPMFKNYAPGNPATVLYVKNLAKDVVVDDFYFIFGFLFGSVEAAKSGLTIKLMQEGRMRGQAFVTFPSIDLAHRALNLVNGYMFKGKPIIIQFGRNPTAGKTN